MLEEILTLLGVLAVVGVILALTYLFTRYVAGRGLGGFLPPSGGKLRLLDQLPLGRDQKIVVVQVGERCLLVGVTPAGVTLLAELTAQEAELWRRESGTGQPTPPSFRAALLDQLKKKK